MNKQKIALKEPDKIIQTDIVVLGSGMGGMSAAVTAAEEGARVVLLEKESILGGGTNYAEGVFGMGSDLQKEAGVNGDLNDLLKIELDFQNYIVDYTLWKFVVDGAEENLTWLTDHGVEFEELAGGPFAAIRTQHIYTGHRGSNMIAKLEEHARNLGVDIHLNTPGVHLLMDGEQVVGVQAENGDQIINIQAKAVILATGSSGKNWTLFDTYTTRNSEKYMWCGAPGITGDGIRMAGEAGMGKPFRLMAPIVGTTVEPFGISSHLASLGAMNPYAIWVNQDGRRFTNEGLTRYYTTSANAVESQIKTFSIVDHKQFSRLVTEGDSQVGWGFYVYKGTPLTNAPAELEQELKNGSSNVFKADTIYELAHQMGMEPAILQQTIDEYNAMVDAGEDTTHHKIPEYLEPIRTAPFYGFRVKGSAVNMFGGIHINSNVEVVREDGSVIPGLYAAGVECGGFQGETYGITVPSSCQGIALSTGRRGAKNAVQFARNS